MRIVVNDIAASSGGAMTVLKDFYTCVKENDKENEWFFLLGDKYVEETENIKVITLPEIKKNPIKKVLFDFFTGKKFINSLKPDVVFNMQNIITFGVKVPQMVYFHQSLSVQSVKKFSFLKKSERKLAFIQYVIGTVMKLSVQKSDKVIVQTKWMKEAVSKKCRIPLDKILQIPPNVKNISHLKDTTLFNKQKFFYPTAKAIYKNNSCIFDACKILDEQGIEYNMTLTLPQELSRKNIDCIGRVPYEDVIDLYNQSTLVFPSYIETFGYPLTEAKKLGAIVLASDCPFCHEALDGYENAYFFNQFTPQELAVLMSKVATGKITRKEVTEQEENTVDNWQIIMNEVLNLSK